MSQVQIQIWKNGLQKITDLSLLHISIIKPKTKGIRGLIWVAEIGVSADSGEAGAFDAEEYALAEGLAVLDFDAEGGAVEQAGCLDCLTGVGDRAAWEGEEGWVGGGAVEAGD